METKHVLLIDTFPELDRLISISLKNHGFQTFITPKFETAKHQLQTKHYDLVIFEWFFDNKRGFDLLPLIPEKTTSIIFTTDPLPFLKNIAQSEPKIVDLISKSNPFTKLVPKMKEVLN